MRYAWLAAVLAAGCGVAVPHTATTAAPPVCGGAITPSRLGAIHFLSGRIGVGLTIPSRRCGAMLAFTRDGGRSWLREGAPLPGGPGQEQLVATSTNDVWAVVGGARLMSTTDGGATWTVETPTGPVLALAHSRRALWMLVCLGGSAHSCPAVLLRKAVPKGVWTIASPRLAADPLPDFVLAGPSVVISESGTVVIVSDRGQRFADRPDPTWMGQPCRPAGLTAASRSWWLLCLGGAAAGSSEKALFQTTDGGRSWRVVSQVTSLTAPPRPGAITREEPDAMAAGSPTRLWLAALNGLYESDDGGARWTWVRGPDPQGSPASFDVLSRTHAWLLAVGQGLWRTTDGRHWHAL